MDGDRADCMWTDPPYGVEYVGKTKDALTIRNDGAADARGLLAGAWAVATATLKPGAAFYIAHPPGALYRTFGESVEQAGWSFRQGLVWVKNTMVLGHSDYHFSHEPIMFGYTDGSGRRGRGGAGWYGDDSQTSVFEVDKPSRSEQHPTMKPVSLITAMIGNSLLEARHRLRPIRRLRDRRSSPPTNSDAAARLVELDCRYADVIVRRWADFANAKPERSSRTEPPSQSASPDRELPQSHRHCNRSRVRRCPWLVAASAPSLTMTAT